MGVVARRVAMMVAGLMALTVQAQEVLLPVQRMPQAKRVMDYKSAAGPVALPFFDDFSDYEGCPSPARWQDCMALVGRGYGELPPTVGMLTLDAQNAEGELYPQATTSLFPADTVTSVPIRLDGLTAADSVVLSFYYLPGGGSGDRWARVGEAPDEADSLLLECYMPRAGVWRTVWSRGGISVDSLEARTGRAWQYVAVRIADTGYFDSLFCFRFRNYCSLESNGKRGMTGNCDQWNIDYVYLDKGRSTTAEPEFRDVAFVDGAPSLLAHYRAMPIRQYAASDMADSIAMRITNLYSSALATQYNYVVIGPTGDTLYRYNGGYENAPPFLPSGQYQTAARHAAPRVQYAFAEGGRAASYRVVHVVREGVGGDVHQQNDTVQFLQVFDNYYAYDDGTAENGYGLTSTASKVYLAYRFDLRVRDTLEAIDMYFNSTLDGENTSVPFYLTVWSSDENGKPGRVLYRDGERRLPVVEGLDRYHRYALEHPVAVSGSVFVGFEQASNDFINIGFDRNSNSCDRIYYLTDVEWKQSILSGSLMLRPYFGSGAAMGVAGAEGAGGIVVYPNPASSRLTIGGLPSQGDVYLYDVQGRCVEHVVSEQDSKSIDVSRLPNGVYLLVVRQQASGEAMYRKVVIAH